VLLVAGVVQLLMPLAVLKVIVAAGLVGLGLYRLWRHRHPRFGGMRVGFRPNGLVLSNGIGAWSRFNGPAICHGHVKPRTGGWRKPCSPYSRNHSQCSMGSAFGAHPAHSRVAVCSGFCSLDRVPKARAGAVANASFNIDLIWAGALLATGPLIFSL
jgi:hypothetical protein